MKSETNFGNRIKDIKEMISNINEEQVPSKLSKVCSSKIIHQRQNMRSPIIINKTSNHRSTKINKTQVVMDVKKETFFSPRHSKIAKIPIQKFQPIDIPQRKPKNFDNVTLTHNKSQEIQIRIEQTGKQCIKKLFKKIRKLEQDLARCEKQKALLELQLKNVKSMPKSTNNDEFWKRLQLENHKLKLEVDNLLQKLEYEKIKPPMVIQKIVDKPIELIKQIPIQKIVEVQVEVPKYIPGPQRVVEKIVQVPKYVEVEKSRARREQKTHEIIQKPVYIDKPVYVDKPIYIDRVVQKEVKVPVQVPIQVPIEVPVYINQQGQSNQAQLQNLMFKLTSFQSQMQKISFQNQNLRKQNRFLFENIQVLKKHNEEKNREVQGLIRSDYDNRRGISIIREVSGLPSSDFSNSVHNAYSLTSKNFGFSPIPF